MKIEKRERTYSTRELAQMWNVSESTIKRWADAGGLRCYRTPGGHRKFRLDDICDFQAHRGFEATGLLSTEQWEVPDIEVCVNQKNFDKITALIVYLSAQNQRGRIQNLLERLYMRGMGLADLYDDILIPVAKVTEQEQQAGRLSSGQVRLASNNVEAAMYGFFPKVLRRRQNGKTALCASPDSLCVRWLNGISRILEVEGWECLNLGTSVPFKTMAEMVEKEPVNLVCLVASSPLLEQELAAQYEPLSEAADSYRIPVILVGDGFADLGVRQHFAHQEYSSNFRSFRHDVLKLSR